MCVCVCVCVCVCLFVHVCMSEDDKKCFPACKITYHNIVQ